MQYLTGEKFSTSYRLEFEDQHALESRFDFIDREFSGRDVIHVGCVDHLPVIDRKISTDRWIHGRITDVAKRCIGFDINSEGIEYLKQKHSITNVVYHDACEGPPEDLGEGQWDYMFIGEVVEHIDNPVQFLSTIRKRWDGKVRQLVLTIPNAFRLANFRNARSGYELINSDHRFWFSPFTISKIVVRAGFRDPAARFVTGFPVGSSLRPKQFLLNRKLSRYPAFRDTIVLTASF